MSFLRGIFGKKKPYQSKLEGLFTMSTAYMTLGDKGGLDPATRAGFCFRPVASSYFDQADKELREMLKATSHTTAVKVSTSDDDYGFRWAVLQDDDFEDLVATVHIAAETLEEKGFGEQILAAVFKFTNDGRPVYWIFNYRRGKYYPFVPSGTGQERDNGAELRLRSLMQKELPMEQQLEYWYPMWGIPL